MVQDQEEAVHVGKRTSCYTGLGKILVGGKIRGVIGTVGGIIRFWRGIVFVVDRSNGCGALVAPRIRKGFLENTQ